MQISPIKSVIKPPLIEPVKVGLIASANTKALGNSIQLVGTKAGKIPVLQLRGETTVRRVSFSGGNTVDLINGGTWPFANGASLTFAGLDSAVSANNKTATVTTVSGSRMTFPASTFVNGVSLNGTVTDGTTTVNITVSPDHPQTLDSLHSFDLFGCGKNLLPYPYAHTTRTTNGITFTDNGDGSITVNGTATNIAYFNFKTSEQMPQIRKGTYTLSGGVSNDLTIICGKVGGGNLANSYTSPATFSVNNDMAVIFIKVSNGATINNAIVKPQLETGSVATTWEKPQGRTVHIDLKDTLGNPLYANGITLTYNLDGSVDQYSAQDVVFKDVDGKWKLIPNIGIVSSINITNINTGGANVDIAALNKPANMRGYGSYANVPSLLTKAGYTGTSWDNINNIGKISTAPFATSVGIIVPKGTTLEAARTMYNGSTFIYPLATSGTPIELHPDCQDALNEIAKSFDGTTNIMLSTDIGQIYVELSQWSDSAMR